MNSSKQALTQGFASWYNAPTANLDAPNSSSQNIKDKRADQSAKKRSTYYRIYVLPLLKHIGGIRCM
jgi:hypothetical protein